MDQFPCIKSYLICIQILSKLDLYTLKVVKGEEETMCYLESCESDNEALFVMPCNRRPGTGPQVEQLQHFFPSIWHIFTKSNTNDVLHTIIEAGHEQPYSVGHNAV
jgi:hypothetical protein